MELIATMRKLPEVLPEYRFSQHVESTLAEYCRFLESREDLLQLAQQYHDAIFEEKRYSLLEIEGLPELDGKEQGLLFAVLFLARCQLLDRVLEAKGIPGRYKAGTVYTCVRQLEKNLEYYGTVGFQGMYRSRMISWLEPNQFILGRLTFQISTFGGPYRVYRNRENGALIPLALPDYLYLPDGKHAPAGYDGQSFSPELREDAEGVLGYTFDENGLLIRDPVLLKRAEYEIVLQPGDDVVNVHIPPVGRLDAAAADDAFVQAEAFFKTYYPQKQFRAWVCSSWLLDTGLKEILKPTSNILQFQSRFRIVLAGVNTFSLYWHIFDVQRALPLAELRPRNQFQETILERVKAGKNLYNGYGFVLWEGES